MSLLLAILVFLLSSLAIGYSGTRLSQISDELADHTGLGEAFFGMIFLGGATSLAGIITSSTAAYSNAPDLAFSNAIGGILVQSMCLAIADFHLPKVNLEHAAASVENLMHGLLLIILLSLLATIMTGPIIVIGHVHIGSLLLLCAFYFGLRKIRTEKAEALWKAIQTPQTAENISMISEESSRETSIWPKFCMHLLLVILAGYLLTQSALTLMVHTHISGTLIGFYFTGLVTSLPELVTSVAAIRQRALILAVGNIVGGNAFEVLILPVCDFMYLDGSLYHALNSSQIYLVTTAILMNSVLVLGLLRREKQGVANIGFESVALFIIYIISACVLFYS